MGEGRHFRGKLAGVVIGVDAAGQAPRHHTEPRRGTNRIVTVGVFEYHPLGGQTLDGRSPADRAAIGLEHLGRELIHHQQENIGLPGHDAPWSVHFVIIGANRRLGSAVSRGLPFGGMKCTVLPMIKWVTGCARPLATQDDGATSILNPAPDRDRAARVKEQIIAAGALLWLVAVLGLACCV